LFEDEKAVVQRWIEMQGNQDEVWDSFEKVMSPDMIWVVPGRSVVSGRHEGLAAIQRDFFNVCWSTGDPNGGQRQGLDQSYGIKLTIDDLVALEDGRILVTCRSDGRGNNGVPYNNEYCWVITVHDGKIVELREWCDTLAYETAMFDKSVVANRSDT
jgi:uncharacterized protein